MFPSRAACGFGLLDPNLAPHSAVANPGPFMSPRAKIHTPGLWGCAL